VKIEWIAPASNNAAIEEYEIVIGDTNGIFVEVTSLCDGSSASVMANLYCIVPMLSFTESPLNLIITEPILAQVRARNSRGWSSFSA